MQTVSVAATRQHLSEILGKVAYGHEAFIITKKGRPMARLLPLIETKVPARKPKKVKSLGDIKGWLEDDDPFFRDLEMIRNESRQEKLPDPFGTKRRK